jgi:hypothetical protein
MLRQGIGLDAFAHVAAEHCGELGFVRGEDVARARASRRSIATFAGAG